MNNALPRLECLEKRALLAGDSCELDGQGFSGYAMDESDVCWDDQSKDNENPDSSQGVFDGMKYASARLGVSLAASGLGIIEGGIAAMPSVMFILGGEHLLGKVPTSCAAVYACSSQNFSRPCYVSSVTSGNG